MPTPQQIQLSFIKDTIAGTVCVVLFNLFRWDVWKLSMVHVVSAPCVFIAVEADTMASERAKKYSMWLCMTMSGLVAFTDLLIVLSLLCSYAPCCSDGAHADFAPTLKTCGSGGVDRLVVSAFGIVTVAVGALQSVSRLLYISSGVGKHGRYFASSVLYLIVRMYELTWIAKASPGGLIVTCWFIAALGMLLSIATRYNARLSKLRKRHRRLFSFLPLGVFAVDALAFGLFFTASVRPTIRAAGKVVQACASAISLWQAWTALVVAKRKN